MRYAIVNKDTNVVENVVELDDESDWTPPLNCSAIQSDSADINFIYKNGEFTPPEIAK